MQVIASALKFAVIMIVLSLVSSTFVEIIHRIFYMREDGLKYMLGQVFDQVLAKYVRPEEIVKVVANPAAKKSVAQTLEATRNSFVERMRANRAPMSVQ